MEKYYDLILGSPLFSGISKEELGSLLNCLSAKTRDFPKGEPVFLEGDPAGFIGFVLEGAVQIVRDDFYGNRSLLAVTQTGELFAEAFACANVELMPVSGYAIQNSKILWLDCRRMLTVCTNACGFHNLLVQNLLQVVAQNNLLLGRKIQFMSGKTTREKLMTYLLDRAKQAGSREFTIPLDRQALADFLGVERSAMSAEISKLRSDGILESKSSWFRLN
jgi:CRP-like cAMP-binding protein